MSRGTPEKYYIKVGLNEILLESRLAGQERIELTGTLLLVRLYLRHKYRHENVTEAWADSDLMKYAEDISGNAKQWTKAIEKLVEKGLLAVKNGVWGDPHWDKHQEDGKRIIILKSIKKYREKSEDEQPRYNQSVGAGKPGS